MRLPDAARRHAALAERGIVAGYLPERDEPQLRDTLLLAATELTTDDDIARLVDGAGGDPMSVADPPRADTSGRGAAFSGATGGEELKVVEPLIFERSRPERRAVRFPQPSDDRARARLRAAGAAGIGPALGTPRDCRRSASSSCCATSTGWRTSTRRST